MRSCLLRLYIDIFTEFGAQGSLVSAEVWAYSSVTCLSGQLLTSLAACISKAADATSGKKMTGKKKAACDSGHVELMSPQENTEQKRLRSLKVPNQWDRTET